MRQERPLIPSVAGFAATLQQAQGSTVGHAEMHAAYVAWCQEHGAEPTYPALLGMELYRHGFRASVREIGPKGQAVTRELGAWQGVALQKQSGGSLASNPAAHGATSCTSNLTPLRSSGKGAA